MMRNAQVRLLARHFLWRFLDNDLISPDSDIHDTGTLVLAFLAVPSLLATALLLITYANPFVTPYQRMLMSLPDKFMYIAWSMLVMALVTLIDWDALSLDARDYAILGPLPIASRTLLGGKLVALALFVSAVVVAVNLVPAFFFPMVCLSSGSVSLPLPLITVLMAGHAAACVGAAVFGFLAILALRGFLLLVLGPRLFRRVSLPVQFVAGLSLVVGFLDSLSLSSLRQGSALVYLSPPMWFLGIYEALTAPTMTRASRELKLWRLPHDDAAARATYGGYEAVFHQLAVIAVVALAAAAVVALVLYFASHFRHASHLRHHAASQPAGGRRLRSSLARLARRLVVRDPIAQASFFFTLQTLARSARHKLYLAGCFAIGALVIYMTVAPLVVRPPAWIFQGPSVPLLSLQFVLSFFVLVGLRVVFTIPAELRANWVFRLAAGGDVRRYLAGVRRMLGICIVVPLFVAVTPVHAVLWGPRAALLHCVFGVLWALVLVEVLLLGFEKLPFTCSHVSGKGNLKVFWPIYLFAFVVYAYGFAGVEGSALRTTRGSAMLIVILLVVLGALAAYRSRLLSRRTGFVFDELPDATPVTLGL
jgi:hypothetical protein